MFFSATKVKKEESCERPEITLENVDQILESLNLNLDQEKETITYEDLRQKVRELAYIKSEEAGHPWGQDKEFWLQAEKELFGDQPLVNGGYYVKHKGKNVLICPISSEKPVEVDG